MDEEAMMFDVAEEERKDMLIAGLKKLSIPRLQILDSGRRGRHHDASRVIHYTIYKCPMQHSAVHALTSAQQKSSSSRQPCKR
jgi:hypothetical protein